MATKVGSEYTTDGSQSDVQAALDDASVGDIVNVPSGSFTWGDSGSFVTINTPYVILRGAGKASTFVESASTAGSYSEGIVRLSAQGARLEAINVTSPSGSSGNCVYGGANDFVVYDCKLEVIGGAYCVYTTVTRGLISSCEIKGTNKEVIFGRGPSDAWQSDSEFGTAENIFIEDCTFPSFGYVCDANANSRFVVRFNTIEHAAKIDTHGLWSNTPPRSARHIEAYNNTWTYQDVSSGLAFELRGGGGRVFNNTVTNANSALMGQIRLHEYSLTANAGSNFFNEYQTLSNYPVADQIGCGKDVVVNATAATEYQLYFIETVGTTDFTLIGAADNNVGTRFIATGAGAGTGTLRYSPASEPMYMWGNTRYDGSQNTFAWQAPASGAVDLYKTQTGDPGASFATVDVISSDRDYFTEDIAFDGTSGVGVGTRAEMDAITPSLAGVGFWVTDEASWNTELPANTSGRLYVWDGASWTSNYEPFTYPHPSSATPEPPPPSNMANPDLTTTHPQVALDQIKADCDTLNALGVGTSTINASDLSNPANGFVSEIAVQATNQDTLNTDNLLGLTLPAVTGDFVDQFNALYLRNVALEAALS